MAPVMRDPALYSMRDLETWVTLSHVLDAHEMMSLERASVEDAKYRQERQRR